MMQSHLFENPLASSDFNLLPKDGRANYYPEFFDKESSSYLMGQLQESLTWEADQLMMFGKKVITRRKVAWVGDPSCSYTYSGVKKVPQPWTPELLRIKNQLEEISGADFNSCLLNFYHDGNDGMGWHSDDEKELNPLSPIASLSLGAKRKFVFRHKEDKTTIPIFLENGSVLMMHSPTQKYWQHALLKTKTIHSPRINLTFRKIII